MIEWDINSSEIDKKDIMKEKGFSMQNYLFSSELFLALATCFTILSVNKKVSLVTTSIPSINLGMIVLGSFSQVIIVALVFSLLFFHAESDFNWSEFTLYLIASILIGKLWGFYSVSKTLSRKHSELK